MSLSTTVPSANGKGPKSTKSSTSRSNAHSNNRPSRSASERLSNGGSAPQPSSPSRRRSSRIPPATANSLFGPTLDDAILDVISGIACHLRALTQQTSLSSEETSGDVNGRGDTAKQEYDGGSKGLISQLAGKNLDDILKWLHSEYDILDKEIGKYNKRPEAEKDECEKEGLAKKLEVLDDLAKLLGETHSMKNKFEDMTQGQDKQQQQQSGIKVPEICIEEEDEDLHSPSTSFSLSDKSKSRKSSEQGKRTSSLSSDKERSTKSTDEDKMTPSLEKQEGDNRRTSITDEYGKPEGEPQSSRTTSTKGGSKDLKPDSESEKMKHSIGDSQPEINENEVQKEGLEEFIEAMDEYTKNQEAVPKDPHAGQTFTSPKEYIPADSSDEGIMPQSSYSEDEKQQETNSKKYFLKIITEPPSSGIQEKYVNPVSGQPREPGESKSVLPKGHRESVGEVRTHGSSVCSLYNETLNSCPCEKTLIRDSNSANKRAPSMQSEERKSSPTPPPSESSSCPKKNRPLRKQEQIVEPVSPKIYPNPDAMALYSSSSVLEADVNTTSDYPSTVKSKSHQETELSSETDINEDSKSPDQKFIRDFPPEAGSKKAADQLSSDENPQTFTSYLNDSLSYNSMQIPLTAKTKSNETRQTSKEKSDKESHSFSSKKFIPYICEPGLDTSIAFVTVSTQTSIGGINKSMQTLIKSPNSEFVSYPNLLTSQTPSTVIRIHSEIAEGTPTGFSEGFIKPTIPKCTQTSYLGSNKSVQMSVPSTPTDKKEKLISPVQSPLRDKIKDNFCISPEFSKSAQDKVSLPEVLSPVTQDKVSITTKSTNQIIISGKSSNVQMPVASTPTDKKEKLVSPVQSPLRDKIKDNFCLSPEFSKSAQDKVSLPEVLSPVTQDRVSITTKSTNQTITSGKSSTFSNVIRNGNLLKTNSQLTDKSVQTSDQGMLPYQAAVGPYTFLFRHSDRQQSLPHLYGQKLPRSLQSVSLSPTDRLGKETDVLLINRSAQTTLPSEYFNLHSPQNSQKGSKKYLSKDKKPVEKKFDESATESPVMKRAAKPITASPKQTYLEPEGEVLSKNKSVVESFVLPKTFKKHYQDNVKRNHLLSLCGLSYVSILNDYTEPYINQSQNNNNLMSPAPKSSKKSNESQSKSAQTAISVAQRSIPPLHSSKSITEENEIKSVILDSSFEANEEAPHSKNTKSGAYPCLEGLRYTTNSPTQIINEQSPEKSSYTNLQLSKKSEDKAETKPRIQCHLSTCIPEMISYPSFDELTNGKTDEQLKTVTLEKQSEMSSSTTSKLDIKSVCTQTSCPAVKCPGKICDHYDMKNIRMKAVKCVNEVIERAAENVGKTLPGIKLKDVASQTKQSYPPGVTIDSGSSQPRAKVDETVVPEAGYSAEGKSSRQAQKPEKSSEVCSELSFLESSSSSVYATTPSSSADRCSVTFKPIKPQNAVSQTQQSYPPDAIISVTDVLSPTTVKSKKNVCIGNQSSFALDEGRIKKLKKKAGIQQTKSLPVEEQNKLSDSAMSGKGQPKSAPVLQKAGKEGKDSLGNKKVSETSEYVTSSSSENSCKEKNLCQCSSDESCTCKCEKVDSDGNMNKLTLWGAMGQILKRRLSPSQIKKGELPSDYCFQRNLIPNFILRKKTTSEDLNKKDSKCKEPLNSSGDSSFYKNKNHLIDSILPVSTINKKVKSEEAISISKPRREIYPKSCKSLIHIKLVKQTGDAHFCEHFIGDFNIRKLKVNICHNPAQLKSANKKQLFKEVTQLSFQHDLIEKLRLESQQVYVIYSTVTTSKSDDNPTQRFRPLRRIVSDDKTQLSIERKGVQRWSIIKPSEMYLYEQSDETDAEEAGPSGLNTAALDILQASDSTLQCFETNSRCAGKQSTESASLCMSVKLQKTFPNNITDDPFFSQSKKHESNENYKVTPRSIDVNKDISDLGCVSKQTERVCDSMKVYPNTSSGESNKFCACNVILASDENISECSNDSDCSFIMPILQSLGIGVSLSEQGVGKLSSKKNRVKEKKINKLYKDNLYKLNTHNKKGKHVKHKSSPNKFCGDSCFCIYQNVMKSISKDKQREKKSQKQKSTCKATVSGSLQCKDIINLGGSMSCLIPCASNLPVYYCGFNRNIYSPVDSHFVGEVRNDVNLFPQYYQDKSFARKDLLNFKKNELTSECKEISDTPSILKTNFFNNLSIKLQNGNYSNVSMKETLEEIVADEYFTPQLDQYKSSYKPLTFNSNQEMVYNVNDERDMDVPYNMVFPEKNIVLRLPNATKNTTDDVTSQDALESACERPREAPIFPTIKLVQQSPMTNGNSGIKRQYWAVTRISVYSDGGKTYEVFSDSRVPPQNAPSKIHNVFVLSSQRNTSISK